ncbi:MAG: hypothetical protein UX98_C0009G0013 [Parcubacteria group bacterium GW2011_GWA2_47_26]|nr:MAG: hypothetical protein UX98_C0009G0013 [Parcubacteria group bacterium GW2011_GWA2_47_26]
MTRQRNNLSDMSEKDFYQVSLKAILKNKDGKILALKAVATGTFGGYYDLPGGRLNVDEFSTPFVEVLEREIHEEIGDEAQFIIRPVPVAIGRHQIDPRYSGKLNREIHVLYIFFEADYLDGVLTISDEHTDHAWLDPYAIDLKQYFKSGILQGLEMYLTSSKRKE